MGDINPAIKSENILIKKSKMLALGIFNFQNLNLESFPAKIFNIYPFPYESENL